MLDEYYSPNFTTFNICDENYLSHTRINGFEIGSLFTIFSLTYKKKFIITN